MQKEKKMWMFLISLLLASLYVLVSSQDIISTIAGIGPTAAAGSFAGDGSDATSARLWYPHGVSVDEEGKVTSS